MTAEAYNTIIATIYNNLYFFAVVFVISAVLFFINERKKK